MQAQKQRYRKKSGIVAYAPDINIEIIKQVYAREVGQPPSSIPGGSGVGGSTGGSTGTGGGSTGSGSQRSTQDSVAVLSVDGVPVREGGTIELPSFLALKGKDYWETREKQKHRWVVKVNSDKATRLIVGGYDWSGYLWGPSIPINGSGIYEIDVWELSMRGHYEGGKYWVGARIYDGTRMLDEFKFFVVFKDDVNTSNTANTK